MPSASRGESKNYYFKLEHVSESNTWIFLCICDLCYGKKYWEFPIFLFHLTVQSSKNMLKIFARIKSCISCLLIKRLLEIFVFICCSVCNIFYSIMANKFNGCLFI